jgi:hypothetical protein
VIWLAVVLLLALLAVVAPPQLVVVWLITGTVSTTYYWVRIWRQR